MTDLFDKRSDKQKLFDWIKIKGYVKSSQVLAWSVENASNRGDRNARQLCQENKIRRLTDDEKLRSYGLISEGVWTLT